MAACKSAIAEANARAAANAAGQAIPEMTYWDYCQQAWVPLTPEVTYGREGALALGYEVSPEEPQEEPNGGVSLLKLGLGAVAIGALGYAIWRR